MFGSANPFAKSASSGSSFSSTASTFGKRISKEDSGNEEDVPPKRSFSGGVNNPFANLGKTASNAAFPSSKPSAPSFGTGAPPSGGGFFFKPSGVFGSDAKEVILKMSVCIYFFRKTHLLSRRHPSLSDLRQYLAALPAQMNQSQQILHPLSKMLQRRTLLLLVEMFMAHLLQLLEPFQLHWA